MDISNKFNHFEHKKLETKLNLMFNKRKDGHQPPRKEDLPKKLAKMKALGLKSISETDWMYRAAIPPHNNFGRQPEFKSDCIRFQ